MWCTFRDDTDLPITFRLFADALDPSTRGRASTAPPCSRMYPGACDSTNAHFAIIPVGDPRERSSAWSSQNDSVRLIYLGAGGHPPCLLARSAIKSLPSLSRTGRRLRKIFLLLVRSTIDFRRMPFTLILNDVSRCTLHFSTTSFSTVEPRPLLNSYRPPWCRLFWCRDRRIEATGDGRMSALPTS